MSLTLDLSKLTPEDEDAKALCEKYDIIQAEAQLTINAKIVTWCYDSDLEELLIDSGIKTNPKSLYVKKEFKIDKENDPVGLEYGDYIETIELIQDGKSYFYPIFCVYNGCSADTGIAFFNPISIDTVRLFIDRDLDIHKLSLETLNDKERFLVQKHLEGLEGVIKYKWENWISKIENECKLKEFQSEFNENIIQDVRPVKRWQYRLTTILYEHYSGIVEAKSETLAEGLILDKLGQTNPFYIKELSLIPMPIADTFIIIKEEIQNNMSKETLERFISNLIEKNCELKNLPYKYEIKDSFGVVHLGTITIPLSEENNLKYISKNLLGIPKEFIEFSNIQPIFTTKEVSLKEV